MELGLDCRIGARRRINHLNHRPSHRPSSAQSQLVIHMHIYSYILSFSPVISPSHLPLLSIQYTLRNQTELTDNVTHAKLQPLITTSEAAENHSDHSASQQQPYWITGSWIAAASARALPARAAHLLGWTYRPDPTTLRACVCTQHKTHDTLTPSRKQHSTSCYSPSCSLTTVYSSRPQAPRIKICIFHGHIGHTPSWGQPVSMRLRHAHEQR